jgi:RHS repeat-associated protein
MEKGNEVKGHGNHYTTKFRQYGPRLGRWLSLDPMKNKFPSKSPYMAMDNSPIFLMDPNGDSTFVKRNKDGTLRVTGGNLADDPKKQDKGVYIKGEDGSIKEQVGESLTSHSFVDGDGDFVKGAVINPNSTEGQDFIDEEIIAGDPSLDIYMKNATNGERYDFKNRGIDERPSNMTEQQYRYRGSVTENGKFASARDFGNMGAGIVAGRSGLAWFEARLGFDGYQYWSRGKFTTEPKVTQKAQKFG